MTMSMSMKRCGSGNVISITVLKRPDRSKMTPQAYARAVEKNRKAAAKYQAYVEKCDAMHAILMVAAAGKPWARSK